MTVSHPGFTLLGMDTATAQSDPIDQQMLELHLDGHSYASIGAHFGVTRERVRVRIRRADPEGYQARQEARSATPSAAALALIEAARTCATEMDEARGLLSVLAAKRADLIRQALAAGVTQADVARELGISPNAINNVLRQY